MKEVMSPPSKSVTRRNRTQDEEIEMKSIAVRENGTSALEVANRYFSTVNLGMSVSPMNQDDVD